MRALGGLEGGDLLIKIRGEKKLFSIKVEAESNDREAAIYRKSCCRVISFV